MNWLHRIQALAVGAALSLFLVLAPCWWSVATDSSPTCSQAKVDFLALYTAANLAFDGPALYDLEQQRAFQQQTFPYPIESSRPGWAFPYFYPPLLAVVLSPLRWLSFSGAFVAMTALNLVLLVLSLRLLIARLELTRQQSTWLVLAAACNYGAYYALLQGQTSFISLAILALYVTASGKSAGAWAGLMVFKPSLAVVPALALIARRRWAATILAGGVAVVCGLLSLAVVGVDGIVRLAELTARAAAGDPALNIYSDRMQNLRALIGQDYLWWVVSGGILAIVATRAKHNYFMLLALIALLLTAPHLHKNDMTLLILPVALVLKLFGDRLTALGYFGLVGVGLLPLVALPLMPIALMVGFATLLFQSRSCRLSSARRAAYPQSCQTPVPCNR